LTVVLVPQNFDVVRPCVMSSRRPIHILTAWFRPMTFQLLTAFSIWYFVRAIFRIRPFCLHRHSRLWLSWIPCRPISCLNFQSLFVLM